MPCAHGRGLSDESLLLLVLHEMGRTHAYVLYVANPWHFCGKSFGLAAVQDQLLDRAFVCVRNCYLLFTLTVTRSRFRTSLFLTERLVSSSWTTLLFFHTPVLRVLARLGSRSATTESSPQVTDGHLGAIAGVDGAMPATPAEWLFAPAAPPGTQDPSSGGRVRAPLPPSSTGRAARNRAPLLQSVHPLRAAPAACLLLLLLLLLLPPLPPPLPLPLLLPLPPPPPPLLLLLPLRLLRL